MRRALTFGATALFLISLPSHATAQEAPGLLATTEYLFVVRGDWIYQYDIDTLQLRHRARIGQEASADRPQTDGEEVMPAASAGGTAVERGLQWLAEHQDEDGRWDADRFMKHDTGDGAVCDGPGNPVHDVGVTGLALLAFLGAGNTLRSGPHRSHVQRAVHWLRDHQSNNGLYGKSVSHDFIYDHAIATYAMCEAYGLSKDELLRASVQTAVDYLESHRNPFAVWRYQPRDHDNDTSVTSWCLLALKSAESFGLNVNPAAFESGIAYLDQVTDDNGLVGYTRRGERSSRMPGDHAGRFPIDKTETLTAAGLFCRFFLGQDPRKVPIMKASADRLLTSLPKWDEHSGTIDHYYWYYGACAMYQLGGDYWRKWSARMVPAVIEHQRRAGHATGSWDPVGVWGESGGRVYSTALMVLTLESYYRYARIAR
ncbi:MAG TPA: hypothetical protein ENI87_11995 [bacterium]|nr:hypothetical protein [bacterium]